MKFSLNMQKKNSGGLEKSEVWNGQSLIVPVSKYMHCSVGFQGNMLS